MSAPICADCWPVPALGGYVCCTQKYIVANIKILGIMLISQMIKGCKEKFFINLVLLLTPHILLLTPQKYVSPRGIDSAVCFVCPEQFMALFAEYMMGVGRVSVILFSCVSPSWLVMRLVHDPFLITLWFVARGNHVLGSHCSSRCEGTLLGTIYSCDTSSNLRFLF